MLQSCTCYLQDKPSRISHAGQQSKTDHVPLRPDSMKFYGILHHNKCLLKNERCHLNSIWTAWFVTATLVGIGCQMALGSHLRGPPKDHQSHKANQCGRQSIMVSSSHSIPQYLETQSLYRWVSVITLYRSIRWVASTLCLACCSVCVQSVLIDFMLHIV